MVDVSIIIVNYNTRELLQNCLSSVFAQTKDISFEVIVSDNDSKDDSEKMVNDFFPQVIFLKNTTNLGFGKANNVARKIACGKYVFFLNSDTILLNNAIKSFYDFWEENAKFVSLGALGAWLQDKDGNIIHSWEYYPNIHNITRRFIVAFLSLFYDWKKNILNKNKKTNPTTCVPGYITGAALFMLNNQDANFDERFFMYSEEADMEYNSIYKKGKVNFLLSEPRIIHLCGASSGNKKEVAWYDFTKWSNIQMNISYILYLKKNFPKHFLEISFIKFFCILLFLHPKNYKIAHKFIFNVLKA